MKLMFNGGLLVESIHTHAECGKRSVEAALPLTLFISFNPKTEFGQKCLNPALFNDLSANSLYSCGVGMQDTDISSLLYIYETATNILKSQITLK